MWPDKHMYTWSFSKYLTLLHCTELFSWGKIRQISQRVTVWAIPFVAVDLFIQGSKLSEFIQSNMPSNTLLLIPNEFGTVFALGIQTLETLEELEVQYSQALMKPEQETNSRNRLLEALTSRATRIAICLLPFLYHYNPLYRHKFYHNFRPENSGVPVKVIPRLVVSYSN